MNQRTSSSSPVDAGAVRNITRLSQPGAGRHAGPVARLSPQPGRELRREPDLAVRSVDPARCGCADGAAAREPDLRRSTRADDYDSHRPQPPERLVPHARTDAPPHKRKRKRPPAPPQQTGQTWTRAQELASHGHDTPPNEPAPTYGPGRISPPTSTLDRILAVGAGPLDLPAGKIDIPQTPRPAPLPTTPPPFQRGEQTTQGRGAYQSIFGRPGRTVVPPETQAMLEHATGGHHQEQSALYLMAAVTPEDLHKRANELGVGDTGDLANLVHAIDSAFGAPTHNIAGFPQTGRTALPDWQRRLLLARGHYYEHQTGKHLHLPDNPTDQDIVRYSFGVPALRLVLERPQEPSARRRRDAALRVPGRVRTGHAANRAPNGDTAPLARSCAQQLDALRHPGAFVQEHPFQVLLVLAEPRRRGYSSSAWIVDRAARSADAVRLDDRPRRLPAERLRPRRSRAPGLPHAPARRCRAAR
jgi:hypothetical protein